ncbi:MAG TPA: glycosyltransferase family A protein [Vicinamibacterales bacterium]|jgi:glycosyltransferase involved in cell wall biosynthesis
MAQYPSMTYLHQPKSGTAAARNAGLRSSRGDFVILLDGDDRLLPEAAAGIEFLREPLLESCVLL